VREVAIKLRMNYESVNQRIYPKQCARSGLTIWPSVKIDGRRLIPKSFVDTLTPKSVHKRAGQPYRVLSKWRGRKIEEAEAKLKALGLDKAIEALDIPKIDLD